LTLEEIAEVKKDFNSNPEARSAQKRLAKEVTTLVHGTTVANRIEKVSNSLFGKVPFSDLSNEEKEIVKQNAPISLVQTGMNIIDILVVSGLASSKREARTFIEAGAVSINNKKIETIDEIITEKNYSKTFLLKRGKKNLSVIEIEA